jgi:hypothetical protein
MTSEVQSTVTDLPYAELHGRMAAVLAEADRNGISWQQTRFGQYLNLLKGASCAQSHEALPFQDYRSQCEFWEALNQSTQLVSSCAIWSRLDPALLREKLTLVMKGSLMPPEGTHDDTPRNTLLELTTAALFWSHHFEVESPPDARDVIVVADGTRFSIECKRPASKKTLEQNIRRLSHQLRARPSNTVRLAIIGADRLLDFSGSFLKTPTLHTLNAGVQKLSQALSFRMMHWSSSGRRLFPDVPAAGVVIVTTVWVEEHAMAHMLTRLHVFPTGDPNHPLSTSLTDIVRPRLVRKARPLVR